MKTSNRISGAKIAAELGVSQATVSRALNGNPRISQAMREQVQKTAMRLGYVANATARTLVKGRSNLIGILAGGLQVERTANLLIALDAQLREHGLLPYLFYTRSETERITAGVRHLLEQGVDGLIIIGMQPSTVKQLKKQNLLRIKPTIFIDDALADLEVNLIVSDYTNAYDEVFTELKKQKRRNIYALWETINNEKSSTPIMYTKYLGVKTLLKKLEQEDNFITLSPTLRSNILYDNQNFNKEYRNKISSFILNHPECDALICFDDSMAFSVFGMLHSFGRKVPSEVAILGHQNDQLGERIQPTLSTVAPQPLSVAHATVNRLIELIDKPDDVKIVKIPAKFIKRETL